MTVIDEIAAERQRQIEGEGFTFEHDDKHRDGEMALVAALYATPIPLFEISGGEEERRGSVQWSDPWPWKNKYGSPRGGPPCEYPAWDKREKHDRRRRLVIAAALIVAEIERLDRRADG